MELFVCFKPLCLFFFLMIRQFLIHQIDKRIYFQDRARDMQTNDIVALKRIRIEHKRDGIPSTGLREIAILKMCHHVNIVKLNEVLIGKKWERY